MRAARDPAVQRDPARVTAHDLQDHDPLVARRRGVQAIERVHHGGHGGIKTERHRGRGQVVVDRLRHADAVDAGLLQLQRRRHGTVTADDDERFHPQILQLLLRGRDDLRRDLHGISRAYFRHKMPAIGRAENGAAARHDPAGTAAIQDDVLAGWKQPFETILKADDFEVELLRRESDAAKDCVQTRTVAAAGENADPRLHDGRRPAGLENLFRVKDPPIGSPPI